MVTSHEVKERILEKIFYFLYFSFLRNQTQRKQRNTEIELTYRDKLL
jgi:hypothetical protein